LDGLAVTDVSADSIGLIEALVCTGLASSNRVAREFLDSCAISVNGVKELGPGKNLTKVDSLFNKYVVIKRGKKLFHLIRFN
jgi:tyrosyl-tRNA synthetase